MPLVAKVVKLKTGDDEHLTQALCCVNWRHDFKDWVFMGKILLTVQRCMCDWLSIEIQWGTLNSKLLMSSSVPCLAASAISV